MKLMFKGNIENKQQGFVAIIVATLVIVLVGLITIGFTRIVQREQRQALDRQLSKQALFTAESGINATYAAIVEDQASATPSLPEEKTNCENTIPSSGDDLLNSYQLDPVNNGPEYTCILYDKTPASLNYDISNGSSELARLQSTGVMQTITFEWGNQDVANNALVDCSAFSSFPAARSTHVPVLKIDLTSLATLSRQGLIDNTHYIYASPCTGGGTNSISFTPTNRGQVVPVGCATTGDRPCRLTIDLSSASTGQYLLRMKSIYASANTEITATDSGGADVEFENVQIAIDVTAKSNDVIRRLAVSIPYETVGSNIPEGVVQSFTGVCKQLEIVQGATIPVTDSCP